MWNTIWLPKIKNKRDKKIPHGKIIETEDVIERAWADEEPHSGNEQNFKSISFLDTVRCSSNQLNSSVHLKISFWMKRGSNGTLTIV